MAKKFEVKGLDYNGDQDKDHEIAVAFYRAFPHDHLHEDDYLQAVRLLRFIAYEKQKKWEVKQRRVS